MTVIVVPNGSEAFRAGPVEVIPTDLLARLGTGRATAIRASQLADELAVTERTIGHLAAALIDEGYLVGSVCSGERPGYFLCADEEDLRLGTEHIRARALASLVRLRKLRASAAEAFGSKAEQLFDISEFARP
jgi:hypothetical protein